MRVGEAISFYRKGIVFIRLFVFLVFSHAACADTIYVNASNLPGPGDGSVGDPYTAITSAVARLADINASPGHTISVAGGTYTDRLNFTNDHSGVVGATNVMLATGHAIIDVKGAEVHCMTMDMVEHMLIKGFDFTGATSSGIRLGTHHNCRNDYLTFDSCNVYSNGGSGIYMWVNGAIDSTFKNLNVYANSGNSFFNFGSVEAAGIYFRLGAFNTIIVNCNIFGNGDGIYAHTGVTGITVKNSNIINNSGYGIHEVDDAANVVSLWNNFYSNGKGAIWDNAICSTSSVMVTAEAINNVSGNSNNIARNPGFAGLSDAWDFSRFYADSPCIGGGEDGVYIGAYQAVSLVDVSSNTYYVATAGSDTRSKAEAQSPSTPWATITNAVRYAIAGDTVIVGAGEYEAGVTIMNSGSADSPVIFMADGTVVIKGQVNSLFADRVSGVVLDGFRFESETQDGIYCEYSFGNTFRNVSVVSTPRYGMYVYNSSGNILADSRVYSNVNHGVYGKYSGITVSNSVFFDNQDGLNFDTASPVILNSVISSNRDNGVRLQKSAEVTIDSCEIAENSGSGIYMWEIGAVRSSFQNLIINDNGQTGVYMRQAPPYFFMQNCAISRNGTDGVYVFDFANPVPLINTILAFNGGYGAYERLAAINIVASNSAFYSNTSGNFLEGGTTLRNSAEEINAMANCENNIMADPLFKDAAAGDFRLSSGSPCVDAGTNVNLTATDFYGRKRLVGPAVDIGVFEMPPSGLFFTGF